MNKNTAKIIGLAVVFMLISVLFGMHRGAFCQAPQKAAGMIIDIKGKSVVIIEEINNGKKVLKEKSARVMMPVYEGMTIKSGSGATLVMASYSNNKEYKIEPNSIVRIISGRPMASRGRATLVIKRVAALPLPKRTAVQSKRILGELIGRMMIASAIKIKSPVEGEIIIQNMPIVKWESKKVKDFKVSICEKLNGKVLAGYPVNIGAKCQITPKLQYGKEYLLTVTSSTIAAKLDNAENAVNEIEVPEVSVSFRVLPEKDAKKVIAAEKEFKYIISADPKNIKVYVQMADFYKENGMIHQAIKTLDALAKIEPDNPYTFYYLSELYDKLGETYWARKYYYQGLELESKNI